MSDIAEQNLRLKFHRDKDRDSGNSLQSPEHREDCSSEGEEDNQQADEERISSGRDPASNLEYV